MAKAALSSTIRESVMLRADQCCEYCRSQDRYSPNWFTIDHIVPPALGGSDEVGNLAYACFLCNRLKSNRTSVFDPVSQRQAPIFNPRTDVWREHFSWNDDCTLIIGLTPTGRGTVAALQLNREKLVDCRKALLVFGMHPPS
jgi:hypothetical protein